MKMRHVCLILILAGHPLAALFAQTTSAVDPNQNSAPAQAESTAEEVNIGASNLGAKSLEVAGTAAGLDEVIAGQEGAVAQLVPAANGAAVAVIDLAGQADLSRVSLNLGKAKGRLVVISLGEDGEMVDLSTPDGAKKLITDKTLTGEESQLAVDVSQVKAKSVMLYWVPEEPGAALPIKQVGIFTRTSVVYDANTAQPRAVVAPPVPVVPSQQVVAAVRTSVLPAGAAPLPSAPSTTTTLPETIPPSSRAVSL